MAQSEKKVLHEVIKIAIPENEKDYPMEVSYITALDKELANLRALVIVMKDIIKKGDRKKSNIIPVSPILPKNLKGD